MQHLLTCEDFWVFELAAGFVQFWDTQKGAQRSLGQNRKFFFCLLCRTWKQGSEKFLDSSLCNSHQSKSQGRCNVFVELLQVTFSLFNPRESIRPLIYVNCKLSNQFSMLFFNRKVTIDTSRRHSIPINIQIIFEQEEIRWETFSIRVSISRKVAKFRARVTILRNKNKK